MFKCHVFFPQDSNLCNDIMSERCTNKCCWKIRQLREKSTDSAWSVVILFACFICTAISNGCLYSFGVILPELMDYFQKSRAQTGKNFTTS